MAAKTSKEKPVVDLSTLPPEAIIRLPDVLRLYPISKSAWWAGVKDGTYPVPTRLGKRSVGWKIREILDLTQRGAA